MNLTSLRVSRAVAGLSLSVTAASIVPVSTAAAAPAVPDYVVSGTLATDVFTRTVTKGWGNATSGQAYSAVGGNYASVSSGAGRVALIPGRSVTMSLPALVGKDVRVTTQVSLSAIAAAGNGASTRVGVRVSSAGSYSATLRIGKQGATSLNLQRQNGTTTTMLVQDSLLPFKAVANQKYQVEVRALSASPVVLAARSWKVGDAVPQWQVVAADSSTSALTKEGSVAVNSYLSASSTSVTSSYDNLTVESMKQATTATPTPTATTTATPTPTATATATPTPTATTTATPTPTATTTAGSAPVGSTSYAAPAAAIYVVPGGGSSGSGTLASPYGSVATAIQKAPTGSTLVLRGGTYRESVTIPSGKALTLQAYPNEAVWFDGSSPVSGWQSSGNTWVHTGWTYRFANKIITSAGVDETYRYVDPAYPMAAHPDQVWIDGAALVQVGSETEVGPGKFYVDETAGRLVIGSDPTGKTVEASTLKQAVVMQGQGSVLRGLGVRRYANSVGGSIGGAVSMQVPGLTLENLVVKDNATQGINTWAKNQKVTSVTFENNGFLGFGADRADGLVFDRNLVVGNNSQRFKEAPVSGGVKITKTRGMSVTDSVFESNTTAGLWFDMWAYDVTLAGNTYRNNGSVGLLIECSDTFTVTNSSFVGNKKGLVIQDSGHVSVWNNTFTSNWFESIELHRDERVSPDPVINFDLAGIELSNNVVAFGTGTCPILIDGRGGKVSTAAMNLKFDGNLYHRATPTSPSRFACWTSATLGIVSSPTLADFTKSLGIEAQSMLLEGTAVTTTELGLTSTAAASTTSVPLPVSAEVAGLLNVAEGWKGLGITRQG